MNFVTCHDGFTLADLVSYDDKHNEANGDDNADGSDDNRSWNCGTEGPTDDPAITALRARQARNFLVTLLLLAGRADAAGRRRARPHASRATTTPTARTTRLSWVDWEAAGKHADLLEFTSELIALRREHPVFRRRRFFSGELGGQRDISWLTPAGTEMTDADWRASDARSLAVLLNGEAITEPGPRGETITDQSFLLLFNANDQPVTFTLPGAERRGRLGRSWSTRPSAQRLPVRRPAGWPPASTRELPGRAVVVLQAAHLVDCWPCARSFRPGVATCQSSLAPSGARRPPAVAELASYYGNGVASPRCPAAREHGRQRRRRRVG